jgi:hypothetical protein
MSDGPLPCMWDGCNCGAALTAWEVGTKAGEYVSRCAMCRDNMLLALIPRTDWVCPDCRTPPTNALDPRD